MEALAAALVLFSAVILVIYFDRRSSDRDESNRQLVQNLLVQNRELCSVAIEQSNLTQERMEKVCDKLIEIGDCAPTRVQLELRRLEMEYQKDIDRNNIRPMVEPEIDTSPIPIPASRGVID